MATLESYGKSRFTISHIQTDNGQEFAKHFIACRDGKRLTHFYSYPRHPQSNGHVERFNRTVREQFLAHNDDDLSTLRPFNDNLMEYLLWYNTQKPHRSLGNLPPLKYYLLSSGLPNPQSNMYWTPTGGTTSGSSYVNFGWALTPQPASIPTNGSTIYVWVDGVAMGHPTYDQYRADIATLFPGYANSDGAVGFFYLNPSTLAEGAHSIAWSVEDSLGRLDGIGSRYFSVSHDESSGLQGTPQSGEDSSLAKPPPQGSVSYDASTDFEGTPQTAVDAVQTKPPPQEAVEHTAGGVGVNGTGAYGRTPLPNEPAVTEIVDDPLPLRVRNGFAGAGETVYPDRDGLVEVTARAGEPLAICLDPDLADIGLAVGGHRGPPLHRTGPAIRFAGSERFGRDIRPLPVGARLDPQTGVFTWLPGPGFHGTFALEFIAGGGNGAVTRQRVTVTIE